MLCQCLKVSILDQKKNWNEKVVTTRSQEKLVVGNCWWNGGMVLWDWIKLSALKESYPVQLAEYAVANGNDHEWSAQTLRRHDRM